MVAPMYAEKPMRAGDRYERLVAIVPMVGRGTLDDPKRPLFMPVRQTPGPDSFLSVTYDLSDDGNYAVVEFVAATRRAFAPILAAGRPDVKVFEPGKARKQDAEVEIRKFIKNFDADKIDKLGRRGR
jgi:hypothetical protein